MIVFPNAKINIGLNVIKKRKDGYHNIESVFMPIGLKDILEIIPDDTVKGMQMSFSGIQLDHPTGGNLVEKAWEILNKHHKITGCRALLHKVIPYGAGLGGGSADAAFCLLELNRIFKLDLDNEALKYYAKQIGADCPFFIDNKASVVAGIGDELSPLELNLKGLYFVLIKPAISVPTKDAYAGIVPKRTNIPLSNIKALHISEWRNFVKNDFETTVFAKYPKIEALKTKLYERGAAYASMSGSGSTVYAFFETPTEATTWFDQSHFIWETQI